MQKNLQRISASACALVLAMAAHTANAADTEVSSPATPSRTAKAHKPAAPTLTHRQQAICSAADLNHDGSVSLDEFHQDIVQGWHSFGPDAEGYVHLYPLGQLPRIGRGPSRRLAQADRDGGRKLPFTEVVQASMTSFDSADVDQNDVLSLQECMAYERQRRRLLQ